MMAGDRRAAPLDVSSALASLVACTLLLTWSGPAACVDVPPAGSATLGVAPDNMQNAALSKTIGVVQSRVGDFLGTNFRFCVADVDMDQELTFPFGQDEPLDTSIAQCDSQGRLQPRLCNSEELRIYFLMGGFTGMPIPDNVNCNEHITLNNRPVYPLGCTPGYAAPLSGPVSNDPPDFNSSTVPLRVVLDSQPPSGVDSDAYYNQYKCCEGFFCPANLACMIPCPRGSYCPLAQTQPGFQTTCSPYSYPANQKPCGGADGWGIAGKAGDPLFCQPGFFCPTTTTHYVCPEGSYCRKGTEEPLDCTPFVSCPQGTTTMNLKDVGITLVIVCGLILLVIFKFTDKILELQASGKQKRRQKAAEKVAAMSEKQRMKEPLLEGQISSSSTTGAAEGSDSGLTSEGSIPPVSSMAGTGKPGATEDRYQYVYRALAEQGAQGVQPVTQTITIEFVHLSLTLKSNGRKLLDNISGSLQPGHLTAVMGPSGAGKTTFLTAIAGKETYSDLTGHVYINGREGSIGSYRKIIGIVPQDDIVHGNLTVEENLWFSANYRMPRSMTRLEKAVVVERTLSSLALDGIRASRVGTVEERGISGGQRKRVNVGLEMVMEPSLMILDEPTSGLDSTSSRLLVQALQQEAARGVNIGVVLHQPSFSLFQRFSDIMFLAKGGRVAYLGPVAEVEAYFDALGFQVPARINPADLYMDVLEGWVKPDSNPHFNKETIPDLWLEHQGRVAAVGGSSTAEGSGLSITGAGDDSGGVTGEGMAASTDEERHAMVEFFTDAWDEVAGWWRETWHDFTSLFRSPPNLSGRQTPGFFSQFWLCFKRFSKQRYRELRLHVQDYIILLLTGAALGFLSGTKDDQLGGPAAYTYTSLAVSLMVMIAALRTFTAEKLNYWRESASGINKLSYFLAKDTLDHVHTLLKPAVYLATFYFFNNPRSTFLDNYGVIVALTYCATGVAYIIGILLTPAAAQLTCVVAVLVESLIAQRTNSVGLTHVLYQLSFVRWALEAFILVNAKRYSGVWLLTRCALLKQLHYDVAHLVPCLVFIFTFGVLARIGAFVFLVVHQRDKQR